MIEIKRQKDNGYVFNLSTESGQVLLNSIGFSDEDEIKKTIKGLRSIQKTPHVFERRTNHNGEFLFSLKNRSGKLIGCSQLYGSEAGMENGIKNLKKRIVYLSDQNQL